MVQLFSNPTGGGDPSASKLGTSSLGNQSLLDQLVAPTYAPQETQGNPIEVVADTPVSGNVRTVAEDPNAGRAVPDVSTEEVTPRTGMFGVKGTLRDIIGTLGDAFLIQSGNAPMYAPRRREERIGDAMRGAAQGSPDDMIAAAERLYALGYVDQGNAMMSQSQVLQKQLDQYALEADKAALAERELDYDISREARGFAVERTDKILEQVSKTARGMNDEQAAMYTQRVRAQLEQSGLDPDVFFPEGMSGETIAALYGLDTVEGAERRAAISAAIAQQNADANTARANKPPYNPLEEAKAYETYVKRVSDNLGTPLPFEEWRINMGLAPGGSGGGSQQATYSSNWNN